MRVMLRILRLMLRILRLIIVNQWLEFENILTDSYRQRKDTVIEKDVVIGDIICVYGR